MCNIKDQIATLLKQRHHSHKVALEQEKDPRSKHAIDLIARIREDSQLIELIDSLPEETCKDSLQVPEICKENTDSLTSLEEAVEKHINEALFKWSYDDEDGIEQYVHDAFIAGAKWKANQLLKSSPLPEDTVLFHKGVEEGKRLIMEDEVEGEIGYWNQRGLSIRLDKSLERLGYDMDTKVKIIIIKDND